MPDDPQDPTRETFTLRGIAADGTIDETELTAAQVLDYASGRGAGYAVASRQERLSVEEDGTIIMRNSPAPPDGAA